MRCKRCQRGQSLVELLVVSLALVPLFLLLPMVAKYQDVAHVTQVASRYAAFDATINNDEAESGFKPAAQLAQEVRRRFFSNPDAPIKTGDAAGDFKAHQNPFWRDPRDNPLIARMDDVAVKLAATGSVDADQGFTASRSFGLVDPPLYRGEVQVPLVNLPAGIRSYEPLDHINLQLGRQTTVMVSDWAGRHPDDVNARVRRAQGHLLADAGELVGGLDLTEGVAVAADALKLPFFLLELNKVKPPAVGKLELWTDVVPEDRLRTEWGGGAPHGSEGLVDGAPWWSGSDGG